MSASMRATFVAPSPAILEIWPLYRVPDDVLSLISTTVVPTEGLGNTTVSDVAVVRIQ
eukprot:COSAG05_NODE_76_length_21413_cov_40.065122_11_plen_58_part_00